MGKSRRKELQHMLEATLGSPNVYFQPAPDIALSYPCIVYERDNASFKAADNKPSYMWAQRYQVTYIAYDPDSDNDIIDELAAYPYSSYSRHFATSGLNHDVFAIYH